MNKKMLSLDCVKAQRFFEKSSVGRSKSAQKEGRDYSPFGLELTNKQYANGEEYRFGYQGQEKDNDIVESGLAFKYRISDSRIGRFFSVDPLAPQYPHNSSYAFSENRVIDGIELEGAEYLDYRKARVKFVVGYLFIRLNTFRDAFRDAFEKLPGTYGLYTTEEGVPSGKGFIDDRQLIEINESITKETTYYPQGGQSLNFGKPVETDGKVYNKDWKTEDKRVKYPEKRQKSMDAVNPSTSSRFIGITITIGVAKYIMDYSHDLSLRMDLDAINEQTQPSYTVTGGWFDSRLVRHESAVDKVLMDINIALHNYLPNGEPYIPDAHRNVTDMSDIANIMLYGGNGNESPQVRKIAERILKIISKKYYYEPEEKLLDRSTNGTPDTPAESTGVNRDSSLYEKSQEDE